MAVSRPRSAVPSRLPRSTAPVVLPEATRFSEEPGDFFDPVQLVLRVRGIPPILRMLEETKISHNHGPARMPGNWALIYLAYVVGREINLDPWHKREKANVRLWRECGFGRIPSYPTVAVRFAELEAFAAIFRMAANHLIQMARQHEPSIGMWVAVDGTECQTHAQPQHDCGPNDDCPSRGSKNKPRIPRMSPEDAAELRERENAIEDDGGPLSAPSSGSRSSRLTPIPPQGTRERTDTGVRISLGGHWFHSRDPEAGIRAYKNGKSWYGMMHIKCVDVVTGAPLAVEITSASEAEYHAFPRIFEQVVEAVGVDPIACVADRGYATDDVHRYLIERDCTPIIPYRMRTRNAPRTPHATKHADRFGVPVCKHCGLSGDFVRFSAKGKSPRVWFRCPMPTTPGCDKEQSIACTDDIRQLLPIWRTSPIYGALEGQAHMLEHVHTDWRASFRSGGKTFHDRPRRIGIACQQLRANAALVAEWIWVMVRQGWLGSRPLRAKVRTIPADKWMRMLHKARRKYSLFGGSYPTRGAPRRVATPVSP